MRNMRMVFFLLVILVFIISNFIIIASSQAQCEGTPIGPPLEGDLTVTSPFNPPSHYGTDYRAADGDNVLATADGTIVAIGFDERIKAWP